ncbi:nucleoside triphosphate pyrophosphohydrolase [Ilyomonas limi]|uniref:Nucleoside triphosphate pyrophosphohydrolase n=1 Tax=Ilyomonas limi TaxID=2575867 RepID=A0A4U3L2N2_9BACT|nr:nucleoside triphosphate pyrophosphohydrolase [Ilyomonas limi]TKK69285.1 nucleoside triphosphate pyrophosphohydrolase [Ilyomonas limi]
MNIQKETGDSFVKLMQIMLELREQCPWDRKQTIHTLRSMTIEELYELVDAIDTNNWQGIKEELGDVLLHLVFYATIATEQQQFTMRDVIESICAKLIHRHPHIYGNVAVKDEEEVKRNWEKIKIKEGKKSALSGVPTSLPAITKAVRIQEKAKQTGFEWNNKEEVYAKIKEELEELQEAVQSGNQQHTEEEFGDVMFSMLNYARFLKIDADAALEKTNKKFIARFTAMEQKAAEQNKQLTDMDLAEMDAIWNEIKKHA